MTIIQREAGRLARFRTLAQVEATYVRRVLKACEGDMRMAALVLGIGRATLYRWLEREPAASRPETRTQRLEREQREREQLVRQAKAVSR